MVADQPAEPGVQCDDPIRRRGIERPQSRVVRNGVQTVDRDDLQ
ncbi:hypothetical protein [Lentzea indica]|nr:hypothetical protein [Lentzea indica]